MNRVYLSLGSNINPEFNLRKAIELLSAFGKVDKVSSVWQTVPVGNPNQPDYLNAAVLFLTEMDPFEMKQAVIGNIEATLGRIRTSDKNAPRQIDIDIMLFNHDILQLDNRNIPDKEIMERAFVAIPLAEIDPEYHHPENNLTLKIIAQKFHAENAGMKRREDITIKGIRDGN